MQGWGCLTGIQKYHGSFMIMSTLTSSLTSALFLCVRTNSLRVWFLQSTKKCGHRPRHAVDGSLPQRRSATLSGHGTVPVCQRVYKRCLKRCNERPGALNLLRVFAHQPGL